MRGFALLAFALSLVLATSASLFGCDGDTGGTSAPTWTPTPLVPPAAKVTPKRTIEDRNPFGNTAASGNLFVDGDFELTGRQDQMPWAVYSNNGQETLNYETGGRCRSGVRCGAVAPSQQIIGWMSSPLSGAMHVSFYAHPSTGVCKEFAARVLDIDDGAGGTPIYATGERADAQGWCRFDGIVPNLATRAPVLYGTADGKGVVLLDDAVATPAPDADAGTPGLGPGIARAQARFTVAEAERFQATIAWIRAHRRYGRAPLRTIDDPMPRSPLDR